MQSCASKPNCCQYFQAEDMRKTLIHGSVNYGPLLNAFHNLFPEVFENAELNI